MKIKLSIAFNAFGKHWQVGNSDQPSRSFVSKGNWDTVHVKKFGPYFSCQWLTRTPEQLKAYSEWCEQMDEEFEDIGE